MPLDEHELGEQLARLRRGRAMLALDLGAKIGPSVKAAFGIDPTDKPFVIRHKASERIKAILSEEKDRELTQAALAAFGLLPDCDQRLLTERERQLAERLNCTQRTARRRVKEAMVALVEALVYEAAERPPVSPDDEGFAVRNFWATMRLDTPQPELHERRRIYVTRDGLETVLGRISIPRSNPCGGENQAVVREIFGVNVIDFVARSPETFEFTLKLPRPFKYGEIHDYAIAITIPPDQRMRPHYVIQPLVPCERFEVTVRFPPSRPPEGIWLVDAVAPRVLDHPEARGPRLTADPTGKVRHSFENLRQGLAYGIQWWPPFL